MCTFVRFRGINAEWSSNLCVNNNHLKDASFKFFKPFGCMKQLCLLQSPVPYCGSPIVVTISHVFTNVYFQTTLTLSVVRFTVGCEKNIAFLLISKSQNRGLKKKVLKMTRLL